MTRLRPQRGGRSAGRARGSARHADDHGERLWPDARERRARRATIPTSPPISTARLPPRSALGLLAQALGGAGRARGWPRHAAELRQHPRQRSSAARRAHGPDRGDAAGAAVVDRGACRVSLRHGRSHRAGPQPEDIEALTATLGAAGRGGGVRRAVPAMGDRGPVRRRPPAAGARGRPVRRRRRAL